MRDYLALLQHSFEYQRGDECPPDTKADFLSQYIFDFTTYDDDMGDLFGRKMVEVCEAINAGNGKTFEYIKDEDNYRWYLLMVNMPFLANKLEWGTSIRGAWWRHTDFELESCGLWIGDEQCLSLKFDREQWHAFVSAMVEFARTETTDRRRLI